MRMPARCTSPWRTRPCASGRRRPRDSYLNIDAVIAAGAATGAEAIHPGYGFLSENAAFAVACARAGVVFIGPPADAIRAMGVEERGASAIMEPRRRAASCPAITATSRTMPMLQRGGRRIGFPVLDQGVAGGGGKGMRIVERAGDVRGRRSLGARREAKAASATTAC